MAVLLHAHIKFERPLSFVMFREAFTQKGQPTQQFEVEGHTWSLVIGDDVGLDDSYLAFFDVVSNLQIWSLHGSALGKQQSSQSGESPLTDFMYVYGCTAPFLKMNVVIARFTCSFGLRA